MRFLRPLVIACALSLLGLGVSPAGQAGGAKGDASAQKVHITTVDGVLLQGNYYQAKSGLKPVVIMLHNFGQDSHKKGWIELAEDLNAKGYNVLTFDFRGHGGSTEVDKDTFWKIPANRAGLKPAVAGKGTIEYKDFQPGYTSVLVNDIAAVKAFLDRKNDMPNSNCNTSNTILIGAEAGATLGALWLNSEWYRFKLEEGSTPFAGTGLQPAKNPEGKDVIAAVWLSIGSKLNNNNVSVTKLVDFAGRVYATPMLFMYSDGDMKGKDLAKAVVKNIKSGKDKDKYHYTDAVEVKGNSAKLAGADLLLRTLKTNDTIISTLDSIVVDKQNEWYDRDSKKAKFVWRLPSQPNVTIPAKMNASESVPVFDDYTKFLPKG